MDTATRDLDGTHTFSEAKNHCEMGWLKVSSQKYKITECQSYLTVKGVSQMIHEINTNLYRKTKKT